MINALDRHIQVPTYDITLTGWDIPLTDRFIPTGWETNKSTKGVVAAIQHYISLYKSAMSRLDELETFDQLYDAHHVVI